MKVKKFADNNNRKLSWCLRERKEKLSKNNRQQAKWLHLNEKEWKTNEARIKCMSMQCRCAICEAWVDVESSLNGSI